MATLDGMAIVVTGGGRGLGEAYATALAAYGARVVVNDIDVDEAHRVVEQIRAAGGGAAASGHDVADWSQARALVEFLAPFVERDPEMRPSASQALARLPQISTADDLRAAEGLLAQKAGRRIQRTFQGDAAPRTG